MIFQCLGFALLSVQVLLTASWPEFPAEVLDVSPQFFGAQGSTAGISARALGLDVGSPKGTRRFGKVGSQHRDFYSNFSVSFSP